MGDGTNRHPNLAGSLRWRAITHTVKRFRAHAAVAGAVFTLLFGVLEYADRQWDERIKRSLGHLARYQSAQVLDSEAKLERLLHHAGVESALKRLDVGERFERVAPWMDAWLRDPRHLERREHFKRVYDFYTATSLCGISKQCDIVTLCQAFYGRVYNFVHLYGAHLAHLEQVSAQLPRWPLDRLLAICDDRTVLQSVAPRPGTWRAWKTRATLTWWGLLNIHPDL